MKSIIPAAYRAWSPMARATIPSRVSRISFSVGALGLVRSRLHAAPVTVAATRRPSRPIRIVPPLSEGGPDAERPGPGNGNRGEVVAALDGALAEQVHLGIVARVIGPGVQVTPRQRQLDAPRLETAGQLVA